MNNSVNTWAQQHRQLRLFISSTFVDMNDERDALTRIFPLVDEMCRKRGVEFVPLDLRWGINEEDSQEGRIIETCLREIDDSRPFFIGILGNRYGWVPQKIDMGETSEVMLEDFPWLNQAIEYHMSITEMEMQHAILMHLDDNSMNAAFYLRSDAMSVPPEFKEPEGSEGERRLKALKDAVRGQDSFIVRDYDSVDAFADMALKDITKFLDTVYPEKFVATYDEIAEKHERKLKERSKSLISFAQYQDDITKWIERKGKSHLMVTGMTGVGKSYLIADIVSQLRDRGEKVIYADVVEHEDQIQTMEYITGEILVKLGVQNRKKLEEEIATGCLLYCFKILFQAFFFAIVYPFKAALGKAGSAESFAAKRSAQTVTTIKTNTLSLQWKQMHNALRKHKDATIYVVLDNLDDLSSTDLDMYKQLDKISNIRVVTSASNNTSAQNYIKSGETADIIEVQNLDLNLAASYINRYLAHHGKSLDPRGMQCGQLLNMGVAGNPRMLSHILKLMVRFGSHKELDHYIHKLSKIKHNDEVYILTLRHILNQFNSPAYSKYINYIKEISLAFALVKGGLSEKEMKDIFNPPGFVWSMLRPYLFSIFKCNGNLWRPASAGCRIVILIELNDITPTVLRKIADYFENIMLYRDRHIDKYGNTDLNALINDNKLSDRQVQVLPDLYYENDRIEDLYYWATYAECDGRLTHLQRTNYWKKLNSKGIYFKDSGDIDVPPHYARLARRNIYPSFNENTLKNDVLLMRLHKVYFNQCKWVLSRNNRRDNMKKRIEKIK